MKKHIFLLLISLCSITLPTHSLDVATVGNVAVVALGAPLECFLVRMYSRSDFSSETKKIIKSLLTLFFATNALTTAYTAATTTDKAEQYFCSIFSAISGLTAYHLAENLYDENNRENEEPHATAVGSVPLGANREGTNSTAVGFVALDYPNNTSLVN